MHVPSWVMNLLLYIFNFMSRDSVTFGNNFLNIYQGIIFPSLPVSILNGIIMLLLPMHVSNLAVSFNQFLLRQTELILLVSRFSSVYSHDTSCSISLTTLFFLLLWQTLWKCPILLHFMHTLPYAGHCLGWWMPLQYLQGCCGVVWCNGVLALFSFNFLDSFILSNCLDSINMFKIVP